PSKNAICLNSQFKAPEVDIVAGTITAYDSFGEIYARIFFREQGEGRPILILGAQGAYEKYLSYLTHLPQSSYGFVCTSVSFKTFEMLISSYLNSQTSLTHNKRDVGTYEYIITDPYLLNAVVAVNELPRRLTTLFPIEKLEVTLKVSPQNKTNRNVKLFFLPIGPINGKAIEPYPATTNLFKKIKEKSGENQNLHFIIEGFARSLGEKSRRQRELFDIFSQLTLDRENIFLDLFSTQIQTKEGQGFILNALSNIEFIEKLKKITFTKDNFHYSKPYWKLKKLQQLKGLIGREEIIKRRSDAIPKKQQTVFIPDTNILISRKLPEHLEIDVLALPIDVLIELNEHSQVSGDARLTKLLQDIPQIKNITVFNPDIRDATYWKFFSEFNVLGVGGKKDKFFLKDFFEVDSELEKIHMDQIIVTEVLYFSKYFNPQNNILFFTGDKGIFEAFVKNKKNLQGISDKVVEEVGFTFQSSIMSDIFLHILPFHYYKQEAVSSFNEKLLYHLILSMNPQNEVIIMKHLQKFRRLYLTQQIAFNQLVERLTSEELKKLADEMATSFYFFSLND
ncbi:MAG: hypothetical protein KBD63_05100, partial [Bacteriovoracaceae bacterium]|nr:hypothetical protein [Bacteriovoracaceae bacterium]